MTSRPNEDRVDRGAQDRVPALHIQGRPVGDELVQRRDRALAAPSYLGDLVSGRVDAPCALRQTGREQLTADERDQRLVPVGDELHLRVLERRDSTLRVDGRPDGLELDGLLARPLQERLLDERFGSAQADPRGVGADAGAAVPDPAAVVGVSALPVGGDRERVPARRAAQDPREQRPAPSAPGARPGLRAFPLEPGHERLVCSSVDVRARVRLAEVHLVLEHAAERLSRPVATLRPRESLVEPRAELLPRVARDAAAEGVPNHRARDRVRLKSTLSVTAVADRRDPADVDSALDRLRADVVPVVADPVELELGQRGQHVPHQPARGGARVHAEVDRDENPAGGLEPLERPGGTGHAAREPVELRDGDPVGVPGLDGTEAGLEARAFVAAAGLVEVLLPGGDRVAVRAGVRLDTLALQGGGEERVSFAAGDAADADVPDKTHEAREPTPCRGGATTCSVASFGGSRYRSRPLCDTARRAA